MSNLTGPHMAILETRDLVKEFGGFVAVSGVSIRVIQGSIHALIGPNGAGKTTVFNLLTKFLPPTRGSILFDGADITFEKPAQISRKGLVRSFQISAVFPHMTVLDNVRIALQQPMGTSFQFWRSRRVLDELNDRAFELLGAVGLEDMSDLLAADLAYGHKRALELATTLALDPKLLLLDEPTQGMGMEDVQRMTDLIRQSARGRTVLMVEHNMSVVSAIADTITVLQRGTVIDEGPYAQVAKNPRVIEAYMGVEATDLDHTHA
jgi:branched-chain amino acid transport system ATP-binding protein